MSNRVVGLGCLLGALVADQASKYWILYIYDLPARESVALLPGLNLTMVWNHAITFGMLGGAGAAGRIIFSVAALLIVTGLGVWLARTTRRWVAVALGLIIGGAIGNVIDRLRFGAVVDFIHAHAYGHSWPVFNIADALIDCGVAILIIDNMRHRDAD
ncbi:signal peptidase II [Komagataeibacter medellinensis]|uniref:Lipoprotein signal peptidase n=1 Tax=Komagataeibacter medellinensis (strain NBRC 3288 / BCRC 11682 / LMG 1693 / Kondo 51) TaxID=634177 RepID=G2I6C8_KOMMN|nr:signal peptidase II [Komagataeibacter medellinensis]BAK83675.1 lipoprotein signal peptidase [Komagataeibacter medellinensis NBRC 3288]